MSSPTRLIIVEDHALVRAALRGLLQQLPDVEVVAEAADGYQALALVQEFQPTVVVMDVAMPHLNGMETLARIRHGARGTKVLLLSMFLDEEHVLQALHLGAVGYLSKEASPTELEIAIRAVIRGDTYLDSRISHTVIDISLQITPGGRRVLQGRNPYLLLTPRHREILQLVAEGKPTKEIASLLKMKVKTVEVHRGQLMKRLGVHNVAGLVRYAVGHKIVSCE